jgi:photosystem I P700 chlorophyll a apoprotein A2
MVVYNWFPNKPRIIPRCNWFIIIIISLLFAGWLHLQPKFRPSLSWFKNNESRLNHHLSGLLGVSSLAWTGHLVHVAIPASRGVHVGWDNFLTTPPHPAGLTPFFTGNWTVYAENPDSVNHVYGTVKVLVQLF